MKNTLIASSLDKDNGFILVTTLVIMLVLVLLGTFALKTTNLELRISGNDRIAKEDFFNQENCVTTAKFNFRTWLTNSYLTTNEYAAFFPSAGTDNNGNGINDQSECRDSTSGDVLGAYKVRNVVDDVAAATPVTGWEDSGAFTDIAKHPANQFPPMNHKGKPPPGSGTDPTNFEVRRFVITSYSPEMDRNVIVQQGVYKIFNKF